MFRACVSLFLCFACLIAFCASEPKVVKVDKIDFNTLSSKHAASFGGGSGFDVLTELVSGQPSASLTGRGLSDGTSVKLKAPATDKKGNRHIRVNQFYNGVRVFPQAMALHQKDKGKGPTHKLTGKYVNGLQSVVGDLDSSFTDDAALKKLQASKRKYARERYRHSRRIYFQNEKTERIIYVREQDGQVKADAAYLVNFMVVTDHKNYSNPSRPFAIFNAKTGAIEKEWEGLTTGAAVQMGTGPGGNTEMGTYEYGKDYPKLWVTEDSRKRYCTLESENVKTIHMKWWWGFWKTKAHRFRCYEQKKTKVNGAESPLNDAHAFGQAVFDMYNDWYGSAPLTTQLLLRVHWGLLYENAFWDGTAMYFGDGFLNLYPLTVLDIVAHEVSHGVTEQNSQLVYEGQSGGINEAFSDMAGIAAEFYVNGVVTNWDVGQKATKDDAAIRHMDEPEKDGNSVGHAMDYLVGMDVHHSSGVFNKAFYTLATTPGWDVRQAFDVFYMANLAYWQPDSDFVEAAEGALYAADDLGYDALAVMDAFAVVGVF